MQTEAVPSVQGLVFQDVPLFLYFHLPCNLVITSPPILKGYAAVKIHYSSLLAELKEGSGIVEWVGMMASSCISPVPRRF